MKNVNTLGWCIKYKFILLTSKKVHNLQLEPFIIHWKMNLLQLESTSTTKCVTIIVIIILNDKPINLIILVHLKVQIQQKEPKRGVVL